MNKIAIMLTSTILLGGCAVPPTQQEIASADYGSYPSDYKEIVKAHMDLVLKDPDSARYDFVKGPSRAWNAFGGKKFGYAVCAYVNAKNSFGGYTGRQLSYFLIHNGRVIDTFHGSSKGDGLAGVACEKF